MKAVIMLLLVVAFACSSARMSADARVRSALDLLAVVVDPAYQLAVETCMAREELIVQRAEAKLLPVHEADNELSRVRESCQRRRRTFDAIRELHSEAAREVEAGRVEDAEKLLERVRVEWTNLQGAP